MNDLEKVWSLCRYKDLHTYYYQDIEIKEDEIIGVSEYALEGRIEKSEEEFRRRGWEDTIKTDRKEILNLWCGSDSAVSE